MKYFGVLKIIPLLPLVFDSLLKLWALLAKKELLDWCDEIEAEILTWENTSVSLHKYGGLQFNYHSREIGHLHSNGLLDILYNRKFKIDLKKRGRVSDHHVFENSGWISFYIDSYDDVVYAKELLALAHFEMKNHRI